MSYIILNSLALAKALDKEINDYMIANVQGYNAIRWCHILTDNNGKFAVSVKPTDPRIPSKALSQTTKLKLVDTLPNSFYHDKDNLGIIVKTPNYAESISDFEV